MFLGALAFDVEYTRWLEEHNRRINELRGAVNSHAGDGELRIIVEGIVAHYDELFRIKGDAAKADVFHILSGMWRTPAERCFLWLGGFRSSELLKVSHLNCFMFFTSMYIFSFAPSLITAINLDSYLLVDAWMHILFWYRSAKFFLSFATFIYSILVFVNSNECKKLCI